MAITFDEDKLSWANAAAIAPAVAISGGESPTEAEHNALLAKVNLVIAALVDAGVLASD